MSSEIDATLHIEGVRKAFGEKVALQNISFTLERGKVLALIGPSGCGKTTLLRAIAGLARPDAGTIAIAGTRVCGPKVWLPPEARGLGMVFQDYALWPHMSVAENIGFPLEMAGVGRRQRQAKVQEALELVSLSDAADRSPGTLSGGQQQRVALARAVVNQPRLLLMDEPLSNLDKNLRESLALDIRRLIDRLNLTAVFVTHDQEEAYALADTVAVLQDGVLAQVDSPERLYRTPATPQIARFLDAGEVVDARLGDEGLHLGEHLLAGQPDTDYRGAMRLLVPRRAVSLCSIETADHVARVEGRLFAGESYTLALRLGPELRLRVQLGAEQAERLPSVGDSVGLSLDRSQLLGWDDVDRVVRPLSAHPSPAPSSLGQPAVALHSQSGQGLNSSV